MDTGRKIGILAKLAWKTLPRAGAGVLVLLTAGFFCLFPALTQLHALRREAQAPRELLVPMVRADTADSLRAVPGLEAMSPQISLDAGLGWKGEAMELEVKALWADYPSLSFTQGGIFPDGTATAYLALNQAAAQALSGSRAAPGDSLTLTVGESQVSAILSGVFADDSQAPLAYMSYDTAKRLFENRDSSLALRLSNQKAEEDARALLTRLGLTPLEETEATPSTWWMPLSLSLCFLSCGGLLLRQRRRGEDRAPETLMALSGLEEGLCRALYPLRLTLTILLCAAIAALIAGVFRFLP